MRRKFRGVCRLVVVGTCGILLAASASAQDKILRFGLTGDYPPFAERRDDGTLAGADVVVAREVAQAMGARAEFVTTSWQALESDFVARRFDVAIGGLTVTPARARIGTYSIAMMDDGKRPLARCADRDRYATIAAIDRAGVRVQINRGPAIQALAATWFGHATVTVNPVDTGLIDDLLAGRSDVWVTDGVVVDHMARRYAGRLCATTAEPFTHLAKAWLIRSDPALVAAIDAGLSRALADGSWRRALDAIP